MANERRDVRGDPRPWGETTCGYGPREPQCWEPATRHFMWLDNSYVAAACDEHAEFIRHTSSVECDEHAHGADCGMPGALWHFPYEDEAEGYCVFPAPDDASLLVEEFVPISVAAIPAEKRDPGIEQVRQQLAKETTA